VFNLSDLVNLFSAQKPVFSQLDLTPWKRQFKYARKGIGATMISRSKYKPHQGERERARRVRQMKEGIIK
jgi:hypothetical protein